MLSSFVQSLDETMSIEVFSETTILSINAELNIIETMLILLIYQDENGDGNSNTADLIIRVQDVQDTPPFFTTSVYRATIREDIPVVRLRTGFLSYYVSPVF